MFEYVEKLQARIATMVGYVLPWAANSSRGEETERSAVYMMISLVLHDYRAQFGIGQVEDAHNCLSVQAFNVCAHNFLLHDGP